MGGGEEEEEELTEGGGRVGGEDGVRDRGVEVGLDEKGVGRWRRHDRREKRGGWREGRIFGRGGRSEVGPKHFHTSQVVDHKWK